MIVVTGATGNIGRSLVGRLLAEGAAVRALTRDPARAGLPAEAETVRADLTGTDDLVPLLAGAEALFLNLAAGGDRAAATLLDAAVKAGVRRVVLNSSSAVTDTPADEGNFIARLHAGLERAVRDSGLEWTFVRGGNYATNALAWAPSIRASGVVREAHPDAQGVPVHEADLADVAAVALLDRSGAHLGKAYVVTGPERMTVAQQVAEIGRATGRATRVERISEEEAAEAMTGRHLTREAALELVRVFGRTVHAPPFPVSDAVERVTGRPGRTFARWAQDHAADFS
ncbi:SDR family oxidoreductase [Streptomyces hygroscopicus]|uniref:SDR family oxidoreductase n=1 Tax=Streptomyces hygroscopicus TaxID=1912 RepID=UPI001FCCB783|nr:NAD(P)H-binding protein [Streptomyces hygroscopicus]BDH15796.1 nucleotide-diphosphate-sugar epimerase [Streptomyces hygroscopicus]